MANRTKHTPEKKAAFCDMIVETGGNVTRAAKAMGLSRKHCYDLKDKDAAFSQMWDDAVEAGTELLEAAAYKRAMGIERDVFGRDGKKTGTIHEYNTTLTIFLLKGRRPEKYRERTQVDYTGDLTVYEGQDKSAKDKLSNILFRRATRLSHKGVAPGSNGN